MRFEELIDRLSDLVAEAMATLDAEQVLSAIEITEMSLREQMADEE